MRKHLNTDSLFNSMRTGFDKITDHRPGNHNISLTDALMSGFAVFSLKDPSLLAFDQRRKCCLHNLCTIYGITTIPCDSSMRAILDGVEPETIRLLFKDIFSNLQRGKALEKFVYMDDCYLLSLDGTGYFSSPVLHSPSCMEKKSKKTGKVTSYYLQSVSHRLQLDQSVVFAQHSLLIRENVATSSRLLDNKHPAYVPKFLQTYHFLQWSNARQPQTMLSGLFEFSQKLY